MPKPRVVHVLNVLSPYLLVDDRTYPVKVRWSTREGSWAGIFEELWSDILCREILKVTSDFDLQVWQPDVRADRVYSHSFDDGLTHVLFPAQCPGLTGNEDAPDPAGIRCPDLFKAIDQADPGTVFHLNELANPLTERVLGQLSPRPMRVVLEQHGGFTYASMARHGKNLLRRWGYWRKASRQRRLCLRVSHAVVQTELSRRDISQIYSGEIDVIPEMVDFEKWPPGDKDSARKLLGLPADAFVLLAASLLRRKKQIDKLVRVLLDLARRHPGFLLLVVGGGDPCYEAELKQLAAPLTGGKILFLGRVDDKTLLAAYHAADLFLSVARGEAGPVSVMKAFACQVPVFTTDTGHTAEFMKARGAQLVVPDSQAVWMERLSSILGGERIPVVPREAARAVYDYPIRARRFAEIYRGVLGRDGR